MAANGLAETLVLVVHQERPVRSGRSDAERHSGAGAGRRQRVLAKTHFAGIARRSWDPC